MLIKWQDVEYTLDIDRMTVANAAVIKKHTGYTVMTLMDGIRVGDPDAMRATYWLMQIQSGNQCDIDRVDFVILDYMQALIKGIEEEQEIAESAPEESGPKGE